MRIITKILIVIFLSQQIMASEETAQEKEIIEIGKAAASLLQSTLKGKMKKELKKDDKLQMVVFCINQAREITKGVNNLLPSGVSVKRTSLKYRSEENKPSKEDITYLEYFQNRFDQNKNIKNQFKLVQNKNGYKYYKPIMINKVCLNCHGDKKDLHTEILQKLEEKYPLNKAYGYKDGDFRGLFVVDINKRAYK